MPRLLYLNPKQEARYFLQQCVEIFILNNSLSFILSIPTPSKGIGPRKRGKMAKEWILNSAMNRFQMNFKRNVGPVMEEIRKCGPKSLFDWKQYYFDNVKPKEHLEELGRKLYVKITEVISSEVETVTEEDCIQYIFEVVINRTFDGYITEIKTIYGQLQEILG